MEWIFWVQLIIGAFVQAVHFLCNPETRSTILLDREAKRRRKTGEDPNIYGPNEIRGGHKMNFKEVGTIFWRYVTDSGHGSLTANEHKGHSTCSSLSQLFYGYLCLAASATL